MTCCGRECSGVVLLPVRFPNLSNADLLVQKTAHPTLGRHVLCGSGLG